MTEVNIYYPNEEPEKPTESVIDSMNHLLAENTPDGGRMWTVQQIAEVLGIEAPDYHKLMTEHGEEMAEGVKGYLKLDETGVPEAFDNRLDAGVLAVHIMEMKHKYLNDYLDEGK